MKWSVLSWASKSPSFYTAISASCTAEYNCCSAVNVVSLSYFSCSVPRFYLFFWEMLKYTYTYTIQLPSIYFVIHLAFWRARLSAPVIMQGLISCLRTVLFSAPAHHTETEYNAGWESPVLLGETDVSAVSLGHHQWYMLLSITTSYSFLMDQVYIKVTEVLTSYFCLLHKATCQRLASSLTLNRYACKVLCLCLWFALRVSIYFRTKTSSDHISLRDKNRRNFRNTSQGRN